MKYYSRGKKGKSQAGWETAHKWLRAVTDYLVCAYMLMILAVLPLYFRGGYTDIATRKNSLFGKGSMAMAKILVPVLLAYGLVSLFLYLRKNRPLPLKEGCKRLWADIRGGISAVDIFAAWYGVVLVISFLCTDYKEAALWGAKGWYMGLAAQSVMVGSYFLISRLWRPRTWFFYVMLSISGVVFLLGYLNRFSIYPIKMVDAQVNFISTIGNINWYCGYVSTVFFAGVAFLVQGCGLTPGREGGAKGGRRGGSKGKRGCREKASALGGLRWRRAALAFYVFLGFATLVTQGSDSGILVLGVMLLVLFGLCADDGERMLGFGTLWLLLWSACLFMGLFRLAAPEALNYKDGFVEACTRGALPAFMTLLALAFAGWLRGAVKKGTYRKKLFQASARVLAAAALCAGAVLAVLLVVNTANPGSIGKLSEYGLFTFSDEWGSNRGATWKCGLRVFMEQDPLHKLIGVGPDAMAAYIYEDGSGELLAAVRDNFGYARLTNAHNEWITILADTGLLGLAGFGAMMASAVVILLGRDKRSPLAWACGLCLLAYTVHNIFSFQQVTNTPTVFVLMGMGMAFRRTAEKAGIKNLNGDGGGTV